MFNIKKMLVLSPHTDDGELGAGAFINKVLRLGADVKYVAFSDCQESLPEGMESDTLRKECYAAMKSFGINDNNINILNYKVRYFPSNRQDILEELIKIKKEYNPDTVLVPSSYDIHQDHKVIYEEAFRAFKNVTLLGYELPWNCITFSRDLVVEVSEDDVKAKNKAIKQYSSQNSREYTNETYITSLSRTRGALINTSYAEVFEVIRSVWRDK
jgi:LmbE family N-acetylglucosaminyl deacetylase